MGKYYIIVHVTKHVIMSSFNFICDMDSFHCCRGEEGGLVAPPSPILGNISCSNLSMWLPQAIKYF